MMPIGIVLLEVIMNKLQAEVAIVSEARALYITRECEEGSEHFHLSLELVNKETIFIGSFFSSLSALEAGSWWFKQLTLGLSVQEVWERFGYRSDLWRIIT
jgi:hypothetical protein